MLLQGGGTARGEAAGCMNKVCKDINIFKNCTGGAVSVRKYITCRQCKSGRCDVGNTNTRTCDTDLAQAQQFKFIQMGSTEVCNCANAPAGTFAERSGNYDSGEWTNSVEKQRLCEGS
jgi:hypothetical protein